MKLREKHPNIKITESHPKALLKAVKLPDDNGEAFKRKFGLSGKFSSEHGRDALVAAVSAREGFSGRWTMDLSLNTTSLEINPKKLWFGPVSYWWPDTSL